MVDWEQQRTLNRAQALDKVERGHVRDVDEVLPGVIQETETLERQPTKATAHPKLDRAKQQGARTVDDCRALAEGLNAKMLEIGQIVESARQPHGFGERILAGLGRAGVEWADHRYASLRQERLRNLSLADAVKEVQHYTEHTIRSLGETEGEYKIDRTGYEQTIETLLNKQAECNPLYLAAKQRREHIEAQVKELEPKLADVPQAERPALERQYEQARRTLEAAAFEEKTALATLTEAQRALPTIQQSRDAASAAIQSIHYMRQASLEKFVNFRFMLEHAITALKAQAHIEEYLATDPAFNAMISSISKNNISTAGAALEAWADRARKAAVDPELAQTLIEELLSNVEDARNDLIAIEGQVTKGERMPLIQAREKVAIAATHHEEQQAARAIDPDAE